MPILVHGSKIEISKRSGVYYPRSCPSCKGDLEFVIIVKNTTVFGANIGNWGDDFYGSKCWKCNNMYYVAPEGVILAELTFSNPSYASMIIEDEIEINQQIKIQERQIAKAKRKEVEFLPIVIPKSKNVISLKKGEKFSPMDAVKGMLVCCDNPNYPFTIISVNKYASTVEIRYETQDGKRITKVYSGAEEFTFIRM